MYNM